MSACSGSTDTPATVETTTNGNSSLAIFTTNAKSAVRVAYCTAQQSTETGSLVSATGGIATNNGNQQKTLIQKPLSAALTHALQQDLRPRYVCM